MFTLLKMAGIFAAALTLGAGSSSWAVEEPEAVPGEYIVKLKEAPIVSRLLRRPTMLSEQLGASVERHIGSHAILVKRAPIETQESAIQVLSRDPLVEYVEPNYIYRAAIQPSHDMYGRQWGLRKVPEPNSLFRVDINAEAAWDMTTGSKSVLVAVIDSGIDYEHPNLVENIWTNPGESGKDSAGRDKSSNGIDDDSNGYIDDVHGVDFTRSGGGPIDSETHGTHCAGIIGAYSSDGRGVVGVNWNVKLVSVRFLNKAGEGTLDRAVNSIKYAIAIKAKVINASWGGGAGSRSLKAAIEQANKEGILVVVAAGNGENGVGLDNDVHESYPNNYSLENIIAVAAMNSGGKLADFSNYGKEKVHLGAPGVNIWSTVPGRSWDLKSGTSMAAPFVTGVAALVLSALPQPDLMTPGELRAAILSGVQPISSLSEKLSTGGILNAPDAIMIGIVGNVAKVFSRP